MTAPVQTYWIEPTETVATGLRRYHSSAGSGFTCADGYHSRLVWTGRAHAVWNFQEDGYGRDRTLGMQPRVSRGDPRWPTHCDRCDYQFTDDDHWQDWQELIYRRTDTGEDVVLYASAPPGAVTAPPGMSMDAWWLPDSYRGPDGIALMVRLPDGSDWLVDSDANNCTRPNELHECWVRHGDPHNLHVTVDKRGNTCAAGAGSVNSGKWHGFLTDGVLTSV